MRVLLITSALAAVTLSSAAVYAQEASVPTAPPVPKPVIDAQAATDTQAGGDIIVTATRREERLQSVPVAVTAMTPETLRASGVTNIRELTLVAPGFNGGRNFGVNLPVIRGVGSSGVSLNDEPNVATYVDGVYQPASQGNVLELVAVDRVEVLRGPQGTIFGRNATGGLVNIITPDPKQETQGYMTLSGGVFGKGADGDFRGYVTSGLGERAAFDFAALYRTNSGYIHDIADGSYLGGSYALSLRSKLLIKPTDSWRTLLTLEHSQGNDNAANAIPPYMKDTVGRAIAGNIVPVQPFDAALSVVPTNKVNRYSAVWRNTFNFNSFNIESTTSYQHVRQTQRSDGDLTPANIQENFIDLKSKIFIQEVRALSMGNGPFQWIAGLYYFNQASRAEINTILFPAGVRTVTLIEPVVGTASYAGFGEGTYSILSNLKLTLGTRYTIEDRNYRISINDIPAFAGKATTNFKKLTYRGTVQYILDKDTNFYLTYSTGFKSGVFNTFSTSPLATKPEDLSAVEFGIKSNPFHWLRANLSLYHYNYNNLQVSSRQPTGTLYLLQNAAKARIQGGELEVSAKLTKNLSLNGYVTLNDAIYKSFPLAQVFIPQPNGGNVGVLEDVSGKHLSRAPETTFTLGGRYGFDIPKGRVEITANAFHSARVYYDFGNTLSQSPYTLVSGEIGFTKTGGKLAIALYGKNLTDARVLQQLSATTIATFGGYERPREIGLRATVNY